MIFTWRRLKVYFLWNGWLLSHSLTEFIQRKLTCKLPTSGVLEIRWLHQEKTSRNTPVCLSLQKLTHVWDMITHGFLTWQFNFTYFTFSCSQMVVWHSAVGDIYPWRYPLPWPANRAAAWLPEWRKADGEPSQVSFGGVHYNEGLLASWTGPETSLYDPERTAGQDLGAKHDNGTGPSSFCFSV